MRGFFLGGEGPPQLLTIYSIVTKTNATDGNTSSTSLQITPASTSAASAYFYPIFSPLYVIQWPPPKKMEVQMLINQSQLDSRSSGPQTQREKPDYYNKSKTKYSRAVSF